jgi:hypothetical protein
MKKKRAGIPPSVRIKVFIRDGFRCVYCGATRDNAKLQADHVIPKAKGGTDHIDNLVSACRECNIGKGASDVIDIMESDVGVYVNKIASDFGAVPAVALSDPMRESPESLWLPFLREKWRHVAHGGSPIEVKFMGHGEPTGLLNATFLCRGRDNCDLCDSPCYTRVLVVPFRPIGGFSEYEESQIKAAVISGYEVPTMIIMGTPLMFFAVLINERRKGNPAGYVVDQFLEPFGKWRNTSWYPDEGDGFQDLREPYRQNPEELCPRYWSEKEENIVGLYCSFTGETI